MPAQMTICALPFEILLHIFRHLDIHDIVRLAQTSTLLRDTTKDPSVWVQAYQTSSLLLPPGPLPSHTADDLRHALVRSTKLEANWTSACPQVISRATYQLPHSSANDSVDIKLVRERYLIVLSSCKGIECFDVEDAPTPGLPVAIYPDVSPLYHKNCVWDDHRSCVYIASLKSTGASFTIIVVKLHLPPDRPRFELIAEITGPVHMPPSFVQLQMRGDIVAVYATNDIFIVHVPSHQTYSVAWQELPPSYSAHKDFILTPSHLLVHHTKSEGGMLDAFPLPNPPAGSSPTEEPIALVRSHAGIMPSHFTEPACSNYYYTPCIQNGPSRFTLLSLSPFLDVSQFIRLDICLLPDGSLEVLSMVSPFDKNCVFAYWLNVSSSAYAARAVCLSGKMGSDLAIFTMRRDIEDGRPTSVRVIREPFGPHISAYGMAFDGVRGRICLLRESPSRTVEILDFVD